MNNEKIKIYIIGAGNMAKEYCKVLKDFECDVTIVSRGMDKLLSIRNEFGYEILCGDVKELLKKVCKDNVYVINCVNSYSLSTITNDLLINGFKNILVEKPAGLNAEDLNIMSNLAKENGANVFVGYNRRFYASVREAKSIINNDGGVMSFTFDFTEASFRIEKLQKEKIEFENWLISNSTHVIDLAFFLCGKPIFLSTQKEGQLSWFKNGCIFVGYGKTDKNALFSYHANWGAPGRWALEINTIYHKLIFSPLEKLRIQNYGTFNIVEPDVDYSIDNKYKPGLFEEVNSFLYKQNDFRLKTIEEQIKDFDFFNKF